mmetsp:Transcript_11459/g.19390  ORF Transcript_11459/g.19390 Transcript_11459/m.19390 type:complete len:92 (-) Transcript_11459:309-584(-)
MTLMLYRLKAELNDLVESGVVVNSGQLTQASIEPDLSGEAINYDKMILYLGPDPNSENDPFIWRSVVRGPPGTPYEGGRFEIRLAIPEHYP